MKRTIVAILAVLLVVVVSGGCATGSKGPSDTELIASTMEVWKAGVLVQDLDKIMSVYSEDFSGTDGGDKEAARAFLGGVIDQGMLEGVEVDYEEAITEVTDSGASFAPVYLVGDFGSFTLDAFLVKEDGAWMIVDMSGG